MKITRIYSQGDSHANEWGSLREAPTPYERIKRDLRILFMTQIIACIVIKMHDQIWKMFAATNDVADETSV